MCTDVIETGLMTLPEITKICICVTFYNPVKRPFVSVSPGIEIVLLVNDTVACF